MKPLINLLTAALLAFAFSGCSTDNSPFSAGAGDASSTNIISAVKLTVASDNLNPEFIKATYGSGNDGEPPTTQLVSVDSWTVGGTLTISAYAADRSGFKTSGNDITFFSNFGSIEQSCTLADGTCSVNFTTLGDLPPVVNFGSLQTIVANFVIYTLGEESFFDANGNGYFDDEDIFTMDMDEPYLDNNSNGVFDVNVDEPIDVNNDGGYTPADGLYSGRNCQHSSLCSSSPTVIIWASGRVDLITTGE